MKGLGWAALALLAGCSGDPTCPCDAVTLSANDAWAGSPVVLTSAAFTGLDTLPVRVTAGPNTLIFIALGANQIVVLMPQNDGDYALDVELHSGDVLRTSEITIHGFLGASPGPAVSGRVQPAFGYAGSPTGVAYGALGRLTLLNLKTGSTAPLGTAADIGFGDSCLPGVMPSAANPAVMTLGRRTSGGSCSVLAADVGTHVIVLDSSSVVGSDSYPSIYLGAARWMVGRTSDVVLVTGPGTSYSYPCSIRDIVAAPSPGLAVVPVGCDHSGGVPVFDRTSGLPQFTFANVRQITAAAFSPDGDMLYYAGLTNGGAAQLYAADPVTGAVLDAVSIPGLRAITDMKADPNGRWLYLADGDLTGDSLEIKVFDRATLDYVAIWHAASVSATSQADQWRLMIGAERVLYLVATAHHPATGSWVYRWALLN